jgi:hypothetical protein
MPSDEAFIPGEIAEANRARQRKKCISQQCCERLLGRMHDPLRDNRRKYVSVLCASVNPVLFALAPERRGGDAKCYGSLLKSFAFRQNMENMLALKVFELCLMSIG